MRGAIPPLTPYDFVTWDLVNPGLSLSVRYFSRPDSFDSCFAISVLSSVCLFCVCVHR
jgi:hypothetical protein